LDWKQWLARGMAYIQDPATRMSVNLLSSDRENVPLSAASSLMEWCACPGGKTLLLEEARRKKRGVLARLETHLAVDMPGSKLELLQKNLARYQDGESVRCLGHDVLKLSGEIMRAHSLPVEWDIVFVDVPCSNTGVMARKPEVRYRLSPENMRELAPLQEQMLISAAGWVKAGGLLLYSTCSIEPEENEQRVTAFLEKYPQWRLIDGKRWLPHEAGHDGGGAFLLQRSE
jgi:16S rRNA (cytosine967-C5)-methyltransferase